MGKIPDPCAGRPAKKFNLPIGIRFLRSIDIKILYRYFVLKTKSRINRLVVLVPDSKR